MPFLDQECISDVSKEVVSVFLHLSCGEVEVNTTPTVSETDLISTPIPFTNCRQ